jgi:hypothetical protein
MSRCSVAIVAIAFKILAAAELFAQAGPAINIAESPACATLQEAHSAVADGST